MLGFQVTEEDVENVLRKHWARVANADGLPFDIMAERLLNDIDEGAVEKAALKHSTDLDEQTTAAHEEIERQLVAAGVLEPLRAEPEVTARRSPRP